MRHEAWHIYCHVAERPGTGRGRALRALVAPALCAAADTSGTPIEAAALTRRLARLCQAEFPGVVDRGPALPQGRRLRREPQPYAAPGEEGNLSDETRHEAAD